MAKPSVLVEHGGLRLPPGFRFHPTDEELVIQYLTRKVFSHPLPASVIPEIDLGKYSPWDLPGVVQGERYFFHLKCRSGYRAAAASVSGYWKGTAKEKPIMVSGQLVGMKKVLIFHGGKKPSPGSGSGSRTDWIMHEYRLTSPGCNPSIFHQDWVVCRIFTRKRASKMTRRQYKSKSVDMTHLMAQSGGNSAPPSPSSSCVTELSEEISDDGEEGSTPSSV